MIVTSPLKSILADIDTVIDVLESNTVEKIFSVRHAIDKLKKIRNTLQELITKAENAWVS